MTFNTFKPSVVAFSPPSLVTKPNFVDRNKTSKLTFV